MNEFGEFLRKLRGKMTFREAAEKSGVSHAYIRYLEIGKRPGTNTPISPSPEMLRGLAKAYDHPYKDLMVRAGYSYEEGESSIEETETDRLRKIASGLLQKIKTTEDLNKAIDHLDYLESKNK